MAGDFRWSGMVQLGPMLMFPVKARATVSDLDVPGFSMIHNDPNCHGQLKQGEWICSVCGEKLPRSAAGKGYKGVPIDMEQVEALMAEKTNVLALDGLVPADQIDPRYYQKSYDIVPGEGAEKTYVLFKTMLERSNRVAIGKVVMRGYEYIVTIRPRNGVLSFELMYWPEQVRLDIEQDVTAKVAGITLSEQEIGMGDVLAKMLARDFHPEMYRNEYVPKLKAYLESVVDGTASPIAPVKAEAPKPVDLADALAASIAALQNQVA